MVLRGERRLAPAAEQQSLGRQASIHVLPRLHIRGRVSEVHSKVYSSRLTSAGAPSP